MKLRTGFILFSYILSALGLYSLVASEVFSTPIGFLLLGVMPVLFALELKSVLPLMPPVQVLNSKWTLIALPSLYLVLSVPLLDLVTWFLVFIMFSRMIFKTELNDYLFGYLIAIVCILIGAIFVQGLSFALIFFAFYLVLCWALIFYSMTVERVGSHSPPEVFKATGNNEAAGAALFGLSSALVLLSLVLTSAIFITFPRLGLQFMKVNSPSSPITGFSESVTLGDVGKIKQNESVVMRVEYTMKGKKFRPQSPILWRGVVLDHYNGTRWASTVDSSWSSRNRPGSGTFIMNTPYITQLVQQNVYMESFDINVVFTHGTPLFIDGNFSKLMMDQNFVLRTDTPGSGLKKFFLESDIGNPKRSFRQKLPEPDDSVFPDRFLQLPPLSDRITWLAKDLTRDKSTPLAQAENILNYLKSEFGYTLEMEGTAEETPLDHFLFTRKKGHCEYFATAMAILLRVTGIPSRIVNGFTGEEWNDLGDYMIIRQKHAHSWVEAYLPGKGWTVYDPTPPDPNAIAESPASHFARTLDLLRLNWQRYVIRYSVNDQVEILRFVTSKSQGFMEKLKSLKSTDWRGGDFAGRAWPVAIFLVILLTLLIRQNRWGGWGFAAASPFPVHLYKNMLKRLEKLGVRKPSHRTHREFLGDLDTLTPEKRHIVNEITQYYERTRFGQHLSSKDQENEMRQTVRKI